VCCNVQLHQCRNLTRCNSNKIEKVSNDLCHCEQKLTRQQTRLSWHRNLKLALSCASIVWGVCVVYVWCVCVCLCGYVCVRPPTPPSPKTHIPVSLITAPCSGTHSATHIEGGGGKKGRRAHVRKMLISIIRAQAKI